MTAREFFEALRELGPLRVISSCGPSTFEAICEVRHFAIADGFLNAITPEYHWHVDLRQFRVLRGRDEMHARSGRRVLYFELRTERAADPFLSIYLYREKNAEFEDARLNTFARLYAVLSEGIELAAEVSA